MPEFSQSDRVYMLRALELAQCARGQTSPNPVVGAVLVRNGKVIGEGYHRGPGQDHAEIDAMKCATGDVSGAHMYVSLEPCSHHGRTPPCADALIEAKIARVTVAMLDPSDRVNGDGVRRLTEAGIRVDVGLCEQEASQLNEGFVTYHTLRRPFFICKWAMTLDGKIATSTGHSRWITNDASREYVHEIRSSVDAVMVGIGTVLMDNPLLTVRLPDYTGRQPKRLIIDGTLRIPYRAKLLDDASPGQCIIATTDIAAPERVKHLRELGHTVVMVRGKRGLLDVRDLVTQLHKLEIQSVLCEGGSSLNGTLFQAQVIDKVIAFIAPKLVGGSSAKTPITGWSVPLMNKALTFENTRIRHFGDDICVESYVAPPHRRLTRFGKARTARPGESTEKHE
jgi:diaminohydroxyphosphoribosylaminopyrimidine deaminase / 5-amino-6-(5-phosphoribosylamino)uracil reductase